MQKYSTVLGNENVYVCIRVRTHLGVVQRRNVKSTLAVTYMHFYPAAGRGPQYRLWPLARTGVCSAVIFYVTATE